MKFSILTVLCISFVFNVSDAIAVTPATLIQGTPAIELVGVLRIDGTERDLSGLTSKLEDGSSADSLGGFSAIEYSGEGDRFLVLPDRGAGDGAVSYPCRMHEAELVLDASTKTIRWKLLATKRFTSSSGEPLVGSLAAHDADLHAADQSHWTAFDPEGIRRLDDGSLVISEEYGPRVVSVDASAHVTEEFPIPQAFRHREPSNEAYELGACPNRGLEGLAVTPSGKTTVAVLQSPLVQDGKMDAGKCLGLNCRWLVYNSQHGCEREIVYQLDDLSSGVSEILAIDEHRFLVLERDSKSGDEAKIKKIFLAEIEGASNVCDLESLPAAETPGGVQLVKKSLFLDLLDEEFGLGGQLAQEKPEGLCWGRPLADGRKTLWVCCDNDFDPTKQSEIYCFAVRGM